MRRIVIIPAALLLAALALSGCAAVSTTPGSAVGSGGVSAPQVPGGTLTTPADAGVTKGTAGSAVTDRSVIQSGSVTIVVTNPTDAATEAARITEAAGGRVDSRNEYTPVNGDARSATLTLRIPAAALTATLDRLRTLGTVQDMSLSTNDVTMQTQDLNVRITVLKASVDRLLALLAKATTTDTLISLETAISARQGELESLQSQQRYLAEQVAMSTVTLNLISPSQASTTRPNTFLAGLEAGWKAFADFFAGLIVIVGVLLPWLGLAAIITVLVLLLVRRVRRSGP